MLKTSEGGISRMAGSWDMKNAHGEQGRVYGQKPHNNKIKGDSPATATKRRGRRPWRFARATDEQFHRVHSAG